MDPEQVRSWRALPRSERERRVMARLLKGDAIYPSIGEKKRAQMEAEGIPSKDIQRQYIQGWEEQGLIAGYAPVLTKEGTAYFAGLANVSSPIPNMDYPGAATEANLCPFCHEPIADHAVVDCDVKKKIVTKINPGSPNGGSQ